MGYSQLNFLQRCEIYALWKTGHSQTQIAKEIGVHKSTISRELNRNITFVRTALGSWQYKPHYAQGYAEERHKKKPKRSKLGICMILITELHDLDHGFANHADRFF